MGFLTVCNAINYEKKGAATGKAVILGTETGEGDLKQGRTSELYHPPGIASSPTKNDRIIEALVGTGRRVSIASHNYRLEIETLAGETIIYSTKTDGSETKALIKLDNDGNIDMNGDDKRLVTYGELNTALTDFIAVLNTHIHTSAAPGVPTSSPVTPMTLDISASETTTIRTGG